MKKRLLIGLGMALVLVFFARTVHVQAQNGEFEVLYLSDSGPPNDHITKLFRVELDSATGQANLTLLPDASYGPGVIPLNQADAIACTPDGAKLYAINKYKGYWGALNANIGYYDLATSSWYGKGEVKYLGSPVEQIGQAAFSPDGTLYAASDSTDYLYIIDTETAEATLVGEIKKDGVYKVNVSGADIIFATDGTLYLWANRAHSVSGAPRGLYILTLPESMPGTTNAVYLGASGVGDYFTGMAIRARGLGDLVGSTHENRIFLVDKTNGLTLYTYIMYLDGSPYQVYQYGDMTVGPLVLCTKTIGYWKNHSWDDATVTINGETITEKKGRSEPVDEKPGNGILWQARGNNFSMLYAQLIAAKLNCGDCVGITIIDEAEDFLLNEMVFLGDFNQEFVSKTQKKEATKLAEALDAFNNQYACDED